MFERCGLIIGIERNCVYNVEFVNVSFFQGNGKALVLSTERAGKVESISLLACWGRSNREGIIRVEDAIAIGSSAPTRKSLQKELRLFRLSWILWILR